MPNAPTAWSESDTTTACARWGEGFSASQIAGMLSVKRSRNAVIGKIHRMNLSRSDKSAGRVHVERRVTAMRIKRRAAIAFIPNKVLKATRAEVLRGELADLKALEPLCFETGPRTIMTARPGECRYMAGDGPDAAVCGRRTPLGSWCVLHAKLVYQPSRKREREDASIARVTRWLDRKTAQQDMAA